MRFLARARIVIYLALLGLVLFTVARYDVITLPQEGCSPIARFAPGDRLVVDVHPGALGEGDALLFRAPDDELLLGVVGALPSSAPAAMHAAVAAGAVWVVTDALDCPGRDSRLLGPLPRDAVAGRVAFALPW